MNDYDNTLKAAVCNKQIYFTEIMTSIITTLNTNSLYKRNHNIYTRRESTKEEKFCISVGCEESPILHNTNQNPEQRLDNRCDWHTTLFGSNNTRDFSGGERESSQYETWNTTILHAQPIVDHSSQPTSCINDSTSNTVLTSSDEMSVDSITCSKQVNTEISTHKYLTLAPSCFINGCICGHDLEFRDMAYESRKRRHPKSSGVTIRPKTSPLSIKLKHIN